MRLESNEYICSVKGVPDESITITKKALEKWAEHYHNVSFDYPDRLDLAMFYAGKHEVLLDLLKHFETEEL